MRRKLLPGILLLILLTVTFSVGCNTNPPSPSTPRGESLVSGIFGQQNTGIWVTGEGKVSAVPDVAIINLGVEVQADSVAEAQGWAAKVMTDVLGELDKNDIDKKDIQTQYFSIYPVRRWSEPEGKEVLIGYRVTNTVLTKIRAVDDTGEIIDAVSKVGGDYIRINNINFTVDDPTPYYEEAREEAMADAEAKAKHLADLGDVKLGEVTFISEGGLVPIIRETVIDAPRAVAPGAPTTPIIPGETEIWLSVQVAYSIEY